MLCDEGNAGELVDQWMSSIPCSRNKKDSERHFNFQNSGIVGGSFKVPFFIPLSKIASVEVSLRAQYFTSGLHCKHELV
jgi:hypothetical protein